MSDIEVIAPREVPLGGPRAMNVRRTLPHRDRTLIGAWCFADHYGPDRVSSTGGMHVPPHPHTGLQTASWLFTGEIEHRDSAGNHAFVRPGELDLMTAGRGISHSEVSTPGTQVLHGVQLWIALPDGARHTDPCLARYLPDPVRGDGFSALVFLGAALGRRSPVPTHSPLLGAEITLDAGARLRVDVDPGFEHGVLVDHGAVNVDGVRTERAHLGYAPPGRVALELEADRDGPARLLLLGGTPFGEPIVMWWNFVGRTHEEIERYRSAWQAEIGADPQRESSPDPSPDPSDAAPRFGLPVADPLPPLPAPALPHARLRPR